jgi:soluble lytic murein transglycosylase
MLKDLVVALWVALAAADAPPPAPLTPTTALDLTTFVFDPGAAQLATAAAFAAAQKGPAALQALGSQQGPAASLVRAQALRLQGDLSGAAAALVQARRLPALGALVDREWGALAVARGDFAGAVKVLWPWVSAAGVDAHLGVSALVAALGEVEPQRLINKFPLWWELTQRLKNEPDARSLLLEAKAAALQKLGQHDAARAVRLQRYLQEPVSRTTPAQPPPGVTVTLTQQLDRAEKLVQAHRNERAMAELLALPGDFVAGADPMGLELSCRRAFLYGTAARKQRQYSVAEAQFDAVLAHCPGDAARLRQAAFVRAKVISIQDGLRAIGPIEAFIKQYPTHSMADDVLFWAGDLYQRRGRFAEAQAYYSRIDALPDNADYCGEARFRIAWMAYRRGDLAGSQQAFARLALAQGCPTPAAEAARAQYWLGRLSETLGEQPRAIAAYRAVLEGSPLTYYAQAALPRLLSLLPPAQAQALRSGLQPPPALAAPGLCLGALAHSEPFGRALTYLHLGLWPQAAQVLSTLQVAGAPGERLSAAGLQRCGPAQQSLLLVLLLQRAGAEKEAYTRLRQTFGESFSTHPTPQQALLWRTAYPLAFREALGRSEAAHGLPNLFLQSLAREESAFDPLVVSWAEAYGLTQLVLSSAQTAGKKLVPPVEITAAEQLLSPDLNAQLGGAYLAAMMRRYGNNLGLCLVAYNAGEGQATAAWKNYAEADFALFAEEIGISETRAYVKRVLRTFGIYRWLYSGALPALAVEATLPARPKSTPVPN